MGFSRVRVVFFFFSFFPLFFFFFFPFFLFLFLFFFFLPSGWEDANLVCMRHAQAVPPRHGDRKQASKQASKQTDERHVSQPEGKNSRASMYICTYVQWLATAPSQAPQHTLAGNAADPPPPPQQQAVQPHIYVRLQLWRRRGIIATLSLQRYV